MANHYIFTLASLQRCLELSPSPVWFETFAIPEDGSWGVLAVEISDCTFVLHRDDTADSPRIIVISQDGRTLSPAPVETLGPMLQRIHRLARGAANPPLRLPSAWTEFHHRNLVGFFAGPYHAGPSSLRWIAETNPDNSKDVCFWKLTGPDDPVRLEQYKPNYDLYRRIVDLWKAGHAEAKE